jgi:hypothetical protein
VAPHHIAERYGLLVIITGHIVVFGALAAIGAGLHVAAYHLEHETTLGVTGTVPSTAIPVSIYVLALYAI